MDKCPACDFLPNIVFHNTLSICGRIAGWGTRDPRRVIRLYHLVGSHVVSIWWVVLGRFMRRARRPTRTLGLLSSGFGPKGQGTHR